MLRAPSCTYNLPMPVAMLSAMHSAMHSAMVADAAPQGGFAWVNLVILVVVGAVTWPIYRLLRDRISRNRRERWAREEDWGPTYTEANDPDLRRDDRTPPA